MKLKWLGHSTFLIEDRSRLITDPVLSRRLIILRRHIPVPPFSEPDIILISHDHYDHLDIRTLRKIGQDKFYIVPKGVGELLKGFNFVELGWWEDLKISGIKITATPAQHFSGRTMFDINKRFWNSYVIEGERTIFFTGDTGYSTIFREVGNKFNIDVALIPIGAYKPRFITAKRHADPKDALSIFKELKAKIMIPMHWGTYKLAFERLDEPPRLLVMHAKSFGLENRVIILRCGEELSLLELS